MQLNQASQVVKITWKTIGTDTFSILDATDLVLTNVLFVSKRANVQSNLYMRQTAERRSPMLDGECLSASFHNRSWSEGPSINHVNKGLVKYHNPFFLYGQKMRKGDLKQNDHAVSGQPLISKATIVRMKQDHFKL